MAKVLVIDDDPRLRRVVRRMLQRGGHEVVEAQDGVEGTLRFGADHPDIVITDISMPGKEGIETILDLRRQNSSIPILVISGSDDRSQTYLQFAQKLGADAALTKPLLAEDLIREIDKLLVPKKPARR